MSRSAASTHGRRPPARDRPWPSSGQFGSYSGHILVSAGPGPGQSLATCWPAVGPFRAQTGHFRASVRRTARAAPRWRTKTIARAAASRVDRQGAVVTRNDMLFGSWRRSRGLMHIAILRRFVKSVAGWPTRKGDAAPRRTFRNSEMGGERTSTSRTDKTSVLLCNQGFNDAR